MAHPSAKHKCPTCTSVGKLCQEHFKQLKDTWYKKLKDDGFEDIEQNEENLKDYSSHFFELRGEQHPVRREAKEEYYRLVGKFLYDHEFPNKFQKNVWRLHSDGETVRNIAVIMTKRGKKTYASKVERIISSLKIIMLKYYRDPHHDE